MDIEKKRGWLDDCRYSLKRYIQKNVILHMNAVSVYFLFTEMSIYVTKTGMFLINRKILPCKCKTKQSRTSKMCLKTKFINYTSVKLSSIKITGKPISNVHWDTRVRSSSWSYSGFILFWNENVYNDVKQKPKQVLPPKPKEVFQLVVNLESKIRSHFREAKDQNKALVQAAKCW